MSNIYDFKNVTTIPNLNSSFNLFNLDVMNATIIHKNFATGNNCVQLICSKNNHDIFPLWKKITAPVSLCVSGN